MNGGTSHTTQATQAIQPVAKNVDWRFIKKHVSDGTTPLDIKSDKVRSGWKRTIIRVAVENETAGFTALRIGYIDKNDGVGWYGGRETPQAGFLYWEVPPGVLKAGDRLLIRFTDSEDGNILAVYAHGYEEEN